MVAVVLDACVPQWLRTELGDADVVTAHYARLDELSDDQLRTAIEGKYDVLVTLDSNIPFQQKVDGRPFAVIILRVRDQSPKAFRALVPGLIAAIDAAEPGEVRLVG
jgi:predicted nuclease of predicted toxin-antitoxin system